MLEFAVRSLFWAGSIKVSDFDGQEHFWVGRRRIGGLSYSRMSQSSIYLGRMGGNGVQFGGYVDCKGHVTIYVRYKALFVFLIIRNSPHKESFRLAILHPYHDDISTKKDKLEGCPHIQEILPLFTQQKTYTEDFTVTPVLSLIRFTCRLSVMWLRSPIKPSSIFKKTYIILLPPDWSVLRLDSCVPFPTPMSVRS